MIAQGRLRPTRTLPILLLSGCVAGSPGTGAPDPSATPTPEPCVPGDAAPIEVACEESTLTVAAADGLLKLERALPDADAARSWTVDDVAWAPLGRSGDVLCSADFEVRLDGCGVSVLRDGAVVYEDAGLRDEGGAVLDQVLPADERWYGLGEKAGPSDRRFAQWTFWNTDAYDSQHGGWAPGQDPLYLSAPVALRLRDGVATGQFVDHPRRLELDLGATDPRIATWRGHRRLDQWLIAGPTPADVLRRWTELSGRIERPPRWGLGFHQCRWGCDTAEEVLEVADRLRAEGLPADSLWLDIQHLDGFRTFTWDRVRFADPTGLIDALEERGFRTVVIADPGIKVDPGWAVYDDGLARGVFLKQDGAPDVGSAWPGESVWPDTSNAEARAWWREGIEGLLGLGVDGIWLDVNEPTTFPEGGDGTTIPDEVPVHGDGEPTTMAELHNVYANLQAQATTAAWPDGVRPFVLSRAGWPGIQQDAWKWTGDVPTSWWGLQESLPMMVGLGLSGMPLVGTDVGGYSGEPGPELYARWLQVGVLSPLFRAHVTNGPTGNEPYRWGREVTDVSRHHLRLRYALMPYFEALADEAAQTGAPLLRPMFWDWPDRAEALARDQQAMLGPWLLAAPVVDEGVAQRNVWLPPGDWWAWPSGAPHEGVVNVPVSLASLPLFLRAGAILPTRRPAETADALGADLRLDVTPGPTETSFVVVEDAGDGDGPVLRTTLTRSGGEGAVTLNAARDGAFDPGPRRITVRVAAGAPGAVRLDGAEIPADHDGAWIVATFDDPGTWSLQVEWEPEAPTTVRVPFTVLYEPTDGLPHVAIDALNWAHVPLAVDEPGEASGVVELPAGQPFRWKVSRGDWCTVEKDAACEELPDRHGEGASWPPLVVAVEQWRDACEPCG